MEIVNVNRSKLIVSGAVAELFFYSRPDFRGYVDVEDRRAYAVNRARINLKRKINANAGQWRSLDTGRFYMPLFLTLTYQRNMLSLSEANEDFNRFVRRFNYQILDSKKSVLKFVCVPEFQERGAVHYHLVLFNVPFIPELKRRTEDAWKHGFAWYESISDVRNVGAYMVKYLSKDFDDLRLKGKKSFFSSRGLIKPLVLFDDFKIADYLFGFPAPEYIYESDDFEYRSFDLSSNPLRYIRVLRK